MRSAPTRATVVSLFALSLIFVSAQLPISAMPLNPTQILNDEPAWLAPNNLGTFARKFVGNRAVCLEATAEQATKVKHRDPNISLTNLTSADVRLVRLMLGSRCLTFVACSAVASRQTARLPTNLRAKVPRLLGASQAGSSLRICVGFRGIAEIGN